MKLNKRLRAAWVAFNYPLGINKELYDLVSEIYEWTKYKDTKWSLRAKKALLLGRPAIECDLIGYNEGDVCGRDNCKGILYYPKVENCSCHTNPPCSTCVENKLSCPVCFWEEGDEDET
jgi:hypothetical protein